RLGRRWGRRGGRRRAGRGPRAARAPYAQPVRCHQRRRGRRPRHHRLHPHGRQARPPPGGPRLRPHPQADPVRGRVPGPPRGRRPHDDRPAEGRPHPDRRARGRHPGRALRHPRERPVLRRQRLPRPRAERAAEHGGGVRRHRQEPQRGALRRRGELQRLRRWPLAQHRVGPQVRPGGAGPGQQGPDRLQGLPADRPGQPARPLPRLRARGHDDRHQPQAARDRARAPEEDPQEGRPRGRRRHHPDRRRGRVRGGDRRGRPPPAGAVGGHPDQGRQGRRPGAAARRAGPGHPRRPRRLQRGLQPPRRPGRQRVGDHPRLRRVRRAGAGAPAVPAHLGQGRLRRAPGRRAAAQGAGPQGLPAVRRLAGHRPHRGDGRHRRQHRQVRRQGRQPRGDGHPQQPRGRRGDRPPAAAARRRRDHRRRLHRHGAREQPRPRRAPPRRVPGPRPHQAPGRRGDLAGPGPDDPQAGRPGAARVLQRAVRVVQRPRGARAPGAGRRAPGWQQRGGRPPGAASQAAAAGRAEAARRGPGAGVGR
ncbi:MAG: Ribonuclease E, partial [uncultured Gemmatimonadaceae bacterium]